MKNSGQLRRISSLGIINIKVEDVLDILKHIKVDKSLEADQVYPRYVGIKREKCIIVSHRRNAGGPEGG